MIQSPLADRTPPAAARYFSAPPARHVRPGARFSVPGGLLAWCTSLAKTPDVISEDSGVIDLFAIHNRATAVPGQSLAPPDVSSAPPPAFTKDVGSTGENGALDDEANPFAKPSRKRLAMIAGAIGAFVFLAILVASFSGGSSEPPKAAAAAKVDPPPAATIPPPPVVIAAVESAPPAAAPAPPTTGAAVFLKPPARGGAAKGTPTKSHTTAGGVKLTKIQSAGVAGH